MSESTGSGSAHDAAVQVVNDGAPEGFELADRKAELAAAVDAARAKVERQKAHRDSAPTGEKRKRATEHLKGAEDGLKRALARQREES